jgi:uncharacterized glyoxalase superfamily protein PhnB
MPATPEPAAQVRVQAQLSVRRGRAAAEFYPRAFCVTEVDPAGDEHGLRPGPVRDAFGHHWEIGEPPAPRPPQGGRPAQLREERGGQRG